MVSSWSFEGLKGAGASSFSAVKATRPVIRIFRVAEKSAMISARAMVFSF